MTASYGGTASQTANPTRPQALFLCSSLSCQLAYLSPHYAPFLGPISLQEKDGHFGKQGRVKPLGRPVPAGAPSVTPLSSTLQPLLCCGTPQLFCCGTYMCSRLHFKTAALCSHLHFKTAALTPISSRSCQICLVSPCTAKPLEKVPHFAMYNVPKFLRGKEGCTLYMGTMITHRGHNNPVYNMHRTWACTTHGQTRQALCSADPAPSHAQSPPACVPISPVKALPLKSLMNLNGQI